MSNKGHEVEVITIIIFAGVMAIPLMILLARLWWTWMKLAIKAWKEADENSKS